MKHIFLFLLIGLIVFNSYSQTDSLNTQNNKLLIEKIQTGTNSYLVYFQDSLNGPKYNFSIWERSLSKKELSGKQVYQLDWKRYTSDKVSAIEYEIILDAKTFTPISEKVAGEVLKPEKQFIKKHFIYNANNMYTNKDTSKHNQPEVNIKNLKHSFNWEADLETFSILPLAKSKSFAICFYHPGSSTPPAYYLYKVIGSENVTFNNRKINCWVLEIDYRNHNSKAKFWIDKSTHQVLKTQDVFPGGYRFKTLISN
ncbi:hypothetical protein [Chondrinema litorale]|uniref:DUF3108 domain-containing protein n=1 Tax=Chondrinema litorale TaxID=2994555 RepID=UPI0025432977|nr:hypothetical protein [Chondrinema litorale]UZR96532.1 hypothetical protein OQ292_20500 [Chondrinema litorale]